MSGTFPNVLYPPALYPQNMIGFFKLPISHKNLSQVMYALLRTQGKLLNSYHHSIRAYSREQSKGFRVSVIVEVPDERVQEFEEITGFKLHTSEEFQGPWKLNNS